MEEDIIKNSNKILNFQLAFENYVDLGNDEPELLIEIYKDIANYRNNKNKKTIAENLNIQNQILDKCEKLLDIIGKEKFIIYDDGNIKYDFRKSN